MSRETQFREIDGIKYVCTMMPATVAHKTLLQLTEVVGRPVLLAVAKAVGNDELLLDELVETGTHALFERLNPSVGEDLILDLLQGVRVEGVGELSRKDVFDNHFRGRIFHLYKVLGFSVEVNFRDFFDELLSQQLKKNVGAGLQKAGSLLTSMLTSGGSVSQTKG